MDAFCLVELFDFIKERMRTLKIDYDIQKAIGRKFKQSAAAAPAPITTNTLNASNIESSSSKSSVLDTTNTNTPSVNQDLSLVRNK